MKNNKRLLFLVCGFLGGIVGALVASLVPDSSQSSPTLLCFRVAIWSGAAAAAITVGLFAAGEIYHRKPFSFAVYRRGFAFGAVAGAVAGFIAQAVYGFSDHSSFFGVVVVRSLCWGLMGAIIGWRLSFAIPNLGSSRSILAGAAGGFLGGIGFLLVGLLLPELMGQAAGLGILGAGLGLAIIAIEETLRSAVLEIHWAPKEITSVTLGPKPVYLGGGDDHVYVVGLPQRALSVVLQNGQIQCTNHTNGVQTTLKDDSRIKIGKVEIVVRSKTSEST